MKTITTEAEGFRLIAERIEAGKWGNSGLCREVNRLSVRTDVWNAMRDRINDHMNLRENTLPAYMDDTGIAGPRILAALFLALEAEDEQQ